MTDEQQVFTQGFWKTRAKSVSFWVSLIVAVSAPVLSAAGMDWSQVTTWSGLGAIIISALSSPATVVAMVVAGWSAINNPTTSGIGDEK